MTAARAQWSAYPKAAAFLRATLERALRATPDAQRFQMRLLEECGVRLIDILDHIALPASARPLPDLGWVQVEQAVWRHRGGRFPDIVDRNQTCIAFRVECLDHFLRAHGKDTPAEGAAHGPYRRARIFSGQGAAFDAIERNGWSGYEAPQLGERRIRRARLHQQTFRTRRRQFRSAERGLSQTLRVASAAAADLGPHWACALFLRAEQEYWAAQCRAGAVQKSGQDAVGIGWSNVDHYGYECSREHLERTVAILEALGCERRELIGAGELAGSGALVFEQPAMRCTLVLDVDLSPDDAGLEHFPLSPLTNHSRAGLWTAMHGESMLEAGLHRLGALCDQRALRRQLQERGVAMSDPIIDRAPLYRQRTAAQQRPVDPRRVDALERNGYLTRAQAEHYRFNGAAAAHLECVQRSDGFKGFGAAEVAGGMGRGA